MDYRPLKILLMGDASNCHRALAEGLRQLGHTVTLASDGSRWMNTERDIDLSRRYGGRVGGLDLWLRLRTTLRGRLSGFDVVSLATHSFVHLTPQRQRRIFDFLQAHNRSVFYTALGTDPHYVEECLKADSVLPYNEFRVYGKPSPHAIAHPEIESMWLGQEITALNRHIYGNIDGAVSVLYEYDKVMRTALSPDKVAYGGIPIDTSSVEYVGIPESIERVRFFLGRHSYRTLEKGTDILEAAARAVVEKYPQCAELVIVEDKPYKEYLNLLNSAHVILDQIYSLTPATNALLAMAKGLCTVSGGSDDFYSFIGESELHPIYHVEPDYQSAYEVMRHIALNPKELHQRGEHGRAFVEKHNDMTIVAQRFVNLWTDILAGK